jgi:hypothetical protein
MALELALALALALAFCLGLANCNMLQIVTIDPSPRKILRVWTGIQTFT